MTFPVAWTVEECQSFLDGLKPLEWAATECGGMGYRQGVARGHIRLLHDGGENMGPHVSMTGQGCRQFEAEQGFQGEADWRAWVGKALEAGASFTRLDFALDDRSGLLTMDRVRAAIDDGLVVSRFKFADPSGRRSLSDSVQLGDVVHFGSIMSEVSVCMYDKALERLLPASEKWVRCELRAKKKRAQELGRLFFQQGVAAVVRVLYGYLDFKVKGTDSNRSRWATAAWWSAFLSVAEKLRLAVAGVVRTLDRVRAWVVKQVAPSLAALLLAAGGDVDCLLSLVNQGRTRLRTSHRIMLAAEGVSLAVS
jgi:phage replication initiation protein